MRALVPSNVPTLTMALPASDPSSLIAGLVAQMRLVSAIATRRLNRWLKLVLDYALTLPTLLLISPLMLVLAVLIRLDSPSPVLSRRLVFGRKGLVL